MMTCASCGGTGMWRCTSCHGRGYVSRLTANGDMDMSPCAVCGGRRQVRCDFCRGTGRINAPGGRPSGGPLSPGKRRPSDDLLEGRWNGASGSWMEFKRAGARYRVTEGGPLGVTGKGTARLRNRTVSLESTNVILGSYRLELRLTDDQLIGQLNVMGLPVPLVLTRG